MAQVIVGVNKYTDPMGVRNNIADFTSLAWGIFGQEGIIDGCRVLAKSPNSPNVEITAGHIAINCNGALLVYKSLNNFDLAVPNTGTAKYYLVVFKVDFTNLTAGFAIVEGTAGTDPNIVEGGSPEVYYVVVARIQADANSDISQAEILQDNSTLTNNSTPETIGLRALAKVFSDLPGDIKMHGGANIPAGWLLCDGSAVSRATYSELFAEIGTSYGSGDGSTTFNVPNFKGKGPMGYNSSDSDFNALGKTGGAKTHTLTESEIPSHTHIQDSHNHTQNAHTHTQNSHTHTTNVENNSADVDRSGYPTYWTTRGVGTSTTGATTATNQNTTATNNATTATNQNTGGGGAHNNLAPYVTVNFIIKY